jgi:hypothetical protein
MSLVVEEMETFEMGLKPGWDFIFFTKSMFCQITDASR